MLFLQIHLCDLGSPSLANGIQNLFENVLNLYKNRYNELFECFVLFLH